MNKRRKNRSAKRERKRIDGYKQTGKKLQPPLAVYPRVLKLDYHRQTLPQFLWLASLRDVYGLERFPRIANRFLDSVDSLGTTSDDPVSGLVESFSFVPETARASFLDQEPELVRIAVIEPFSAALHLYPDCPMRWLWNSYPGPLPALDLDIVLASMTRWVRTLLDREGEPSNEARAIVFARYIKAGKATIRDPELIDELLSYPHCKDRRLTESQVRADSNAIFGHLIQGFSWGDAFWAANGKLSMCSTDPVEVEKSETPTRESDLSPFVDRFEQAADEFLQAVRADHQKCVPDPSKFEKTSALSGLLARSCALALDILTERSLWVAEIGGIILRCQSEVLIILAWLLHKDDDSLYERFFQYSLGQQDLYGLKLEDYGGYREAFKALFIGGDELANAMSKDSWEAQFRTIDFGNWAGIDTRRMAEEGGTKPYYDLLFHLYSADVHSQFISIGRWNMVRCTNPLHNSHLIPAFGRRAVNPHLPLTACAVLRETCQRFFSHHNVDASCIDVLARVLGDMSDTVLNAAPPEKG